MSSARVLLIVGGAILMLTAAGFGLQTFFFERYRSGYRGAAMLAQALSQASMVKRQAAVHYADLGRLPKDNATLGLGPPQSFAREALRSLEIRDGHIILRLDDRLGENASIVLRARRSHSGVGEPMLWVCETTTLSVRLLETAAPQCTRVPAIDLGEHPPASPPPATHSAEALVNALHLRRKRLVLEIARSGLNLNAAWNGLYPLQLAIEQGDAAIVDALVANGAKADQRLKTREDMTMLMFAASSTRRSGRIVKALLTAGGSLEARDAKGRTALMHAARVGNTSAIEMLLKAGASLDAIDHEGNGPLAYAASHGRSSAVYSRLTSAKHKRNEIIVIIPGAD